MDRWMQLIALTLTGLLFFFILIRQRESRQEMKKEIKEISCIDNDFNEKTLGLVYLVFIQKIYI